jgi:hypothetical protein
VTGLKKPIDNGWGRDKFPTLPPDPTRASGDGDAALGRYGSVGDRPGLADHVRNAACRRLIEAAFAERAALEAADVAMHVWMQPMWRLALALCEQRPFSAEHVSLVADRLCGLPATTPPDGVWQKVLAARSADDWDHCNDHHHVVLRGAAAEVEATAAASYPPSNASSDFAGMEGPAALIRKLVTRETGMAWTDGLEVPVEQLLDVTTRTRPANVSKRYTPQNMLRYLRGETPHGGSGHPVRDELVAGYGVALPVAANLCHIVLGTQAFDMPGGFGSSSAAHVLVAGAPVNDRVAHRWGACLARAVNGGPVAVEVTNAVRTRVARHRRDMPPPAQEAGPDFGLAI